MMKRVAHSSIAELLKRRNQAKTEKRKHRRIFVCLPMEFSYPGLKCAGFAHTINISENGVLAYVLRKLEIGESLHIKIYFETSSGLIFVEALGQVIRVEPVGPSEKEYRCAIRFLEMSSDLLQKLEKMLSNLD